MYSSLDRVDIVLEDDDGGCVLLQTEHRTADEIEAEPELSTLFLLARVINPRRFGTEEHGPARVRVACQHEPGTRVRHLLASAGVELQVLPDGEPSVPVEGEAVDLADLADAAFAGLSRRVLAREDLPLSRDGLGTFEDRLSERALTPELEIEWWTAVAELAALTGELLRGLFGGRWIDDPQRFSTLPFVFQLEDGANLINVADKARRFLELGPRQSPRHLLTMAEDAEEPSGPLLPNLKAPDWPQRELVVCQPLVDEGDWKPGELPLIAYGNDRPHTFGLLHKNSLPAPDLPALRKEAIANLAQVGVAVEELEVLGLRLRVIHDSYFAAEKILDRDFMRSLAVLLDAQMLAVAIPRKCMMVVADATQSDIPKLVAIARGKFAEDAEEPALVPTVFLLHDGLIAGKIEAAGE